MTKRVIAIDPGVETGVALLDNSGVVLAVTDVEPYEFLIKLLEMYPSDQVVCEESPKRGHQPDATHRVEQLVEARSNDRLRWVRPSEWKGHPKAILTEYDYETTSSPHERDAVRIGRWWRGTQPQGDDLAPV